jgi:NMD protein affecting ribosome stability and mRNA decay
MSVERTKLACPACGELADEFEEGVCVECRDARQAALDEHNARFDWWESLTPAERNRQIREALR